MKQTFLEDPPKVLRGSFQRPASNDHRPSLVLCTAASVAQVRVGEARTCGSTKDDGSSHSMAVPESVGEHLPKENLG